MTQETHTLHRTSPKGGPFVGVCSKCGRTGLTSTFEDLPCANHRGTTQEQDLVEAIEGLKGIPHD